MQGRCNSRSSIPHRCNQNCSQEASFPSHRRRRPRRRRRIPRKVYYRSNCTLKRRTRRTRGNRCPFCSTRGCTPSSSELLSGDIRLDGKWRSPMGTGCRGSTAHMCRRSYLSSIQTLAPLSVPLSAPSWYDGPLEVSELLSSETSLPASVLRSVMACKFFQHITVFYKTQIITNYLKSFGHWWWLKRFPIVADILVTSTEAFCTSHGKRISTVIL